MTASHSPLSEIVAQANKIASILKAAERGEKIDARFAEKIDAARARDNFKVGIAMDDKVIALEIPWSLIREASWQDLADFIVDRMRLTRVTTH